MLPPRVDLDSEEHKAALPRVLRRRGRVHGNMPEPMFGACTARSAAGTPRWDGTPSVRPEVRRREGHHGRAGSARTHVAYGLGAERQVKPWFDGRVASVIPYPVAEVPGGPLSAGPQASYANFVWACRRSAIRSIRARASPRRTRRAAHIKVINVADPSAGLGGGREVGDELVSVDGIAVDDKEPLNQHMSTKRWGDTLRYQLLRDGHPLEVTVNLRRFTTRRRGLGRGNRRARARPRRPAGHLNRGARDERGAARSR